jgi:hypothetical protein
VQHRAAPEENGATAPPSMASGTSVPASEVQVASAAPETLSASAPASAAPVVEAARPAPPSAPPAVQPPAPPAPPTLSLAAVTPLLAQVPCSALVADVQGHALKVRGFAAQRYGATRLKNDLSALPGVESLNLDVEQIADDKCDAIKTFAPYWTLNWQAGRIAALHVRPPDAQLTEGDPLVVDVTTPGFDSYVNLDYYVLDGSVVHMVPGPRAKDNQAPPHYAATIGSAGDWIISKPFGTEMVVLLITPVPLFDSLRPESESRADYLHALETRLGQIASKYGQDRIVADIALITTKARTR